MVESVFTKIANKEVPAHIFYEDEATLAFLDMNPLTDGHSLVITKEPIDHLDDCPPELYSAVFNTVYKVSKHLKERLGPKRIGLVVHGFEIPHAHVHVVPMYTGHEMKLANRGDVLLEHAALASVAEKIGQLTVQDLA